MNLDEIKITAEVSSVRELNLYLLSGWVLVLSYVNHEHDSQQPRFVVGWRGVEEPKIPELLDAWELKDIDRQRYR